MDQVQIEANAQGGVIATGESKRLSTSAAERQYTWADVGLEETVLSLPSDCAARGNIAMALDDSGGPAICLRPLTPVAGVPAPAPPTREQVEALMRSLIANLKVPQPTIQVGPEPSANEWNMAVVGLPLWLWTDAPRTRSTTASGSGITIAIDARLEAITWQMGDGNQVTCTTWTPRPQGAEPGVRSPTCGYAYSRPSLPAGAYTVTATARWSARWSALGYSGTVPLTSTATRQLPVGELHALVRR